MTIRKKIIISGWTRQGKPVKMEINPALPGTGIVFNSSLRVELKHTRAQNHTTTLSNGILRISMLEHFLAACNGLGITDLNVNLNGDELPFNDGSSLQFTRCLKDAGIVGKNSVLRVEHPLAVRTSSGLIICLPDKNLRISCLIDYPQTGPQFFSLKITPQRFAQEIAPARTFGPDNLNLQYGKLHLPFKLKTVRGWLFPSLPRFPVEPCRHKILDLLGDLAILGTPLRAEIFAYNPSHQLNLRFVRKLKRRHID